MHVRNAMLTLAFAVQSVLSREARVRRMLSHLALAFFLYTTLNGLAAYSHDGATVYAGANTNGTDVIYVSHDSGFNWTPAGTPADVIARLSAEAVKGTRAPEFVKRMTELGYNIIGSSPEQMGDMLRNEVNRWGPIVKASGAKAD